MMYDIKEGNETIAEYMNVIIYANWIECLGEDQIELTEEEKIEKGKKLNKELYVPDYNVNWNSLIPVIKKIKQFRDSNDIVSVYEYYYFIEQSFNEFNLHKTWYAIVHFLKYYNANFKGFINTGNQSRK